MQPNQQNPYQFIIDEAPKKKGFIIGGNSQKQRLIQVAIAFMILIIGGVILLNVVSNASKGSITDLYKLAAAQQDLIAFTALGVTNVRNTQIASKSATAGVIITSQNNTTIAAITKLGDKKPTKSIAIYSDTTFIKLLDEAKKNGKYDDTYAALFANRLDDYRAKLQTAYASTKDTVTKKKFADAYSQLDLITPSVPATN